MHTQPTADADQKDWRWFECDSDNCEERLARRKAAAYAAELSGPADPRCRGASDDMIDAAIADTHAWLERVYGKARAQGVAA